MCQRGSQRTITISKPEGIEAIICRPHGKDSTIVQSFLFPKAKGWTVGKAKEWFSKHETASAGAPVQYYVRAQAVERDEKKYALIEVIDEDVSGPCESPPATSIRINPAGKARALAGLLDMPLLGPPELGHEATQVVGRPVDFTSNHATQVLYEIPNLQNWNRIDRGEWGPVSPKMTPITAHYEDDIFVLDEWMWDNIAFVPKGAYPSAGVKSTCVGDPRLCGFTGAIMASLNSSKSRLETLRPRTETDVGAYSPPTGKAGKAPEDKTSDHSQGGVIMKNMENEAVVVLAADAWNTADAPDKFFAVVPDEAKGPDGKKSLRKLPLASIQKKDLDADIVRNALARFNQTDFAGTGVSKDEAQAKICSAAKQFDIQSDVCGTVKGGFSKEVSCMDKYEHEKVIAELTDKNTKLEAELKELKAKPPAPAAPVTASDAMIAVQAELKSIKAEYETLKAWKVAAEEADHMRRVQEVVDLQVSTGSVEAAKVQAAVEALKKLPNDALDMMKATLSAVKGKFDSLPSGPKARLIPSASAAGHFDPTQATVGSLVGKKLGEM